MGPIYLSNLSYNRKFFKEKKVKRNVTNSCSKNVKTHSDCNHVKSSINFKKKMFINALMAFYRFKYTYVYLERVGCIF